MHEKSKMQGGKHWILPKERNANWFFGDSHWLEIWKNHLHSFKELNRGSVALDSVIKSNTVTRFKIISGLQNSLQNHRRVPVCRNRQFEEVYWKDFHN
jgi:hypothetical protein